MSSLTFLNKMGMVSFKLFFKDFGSLFLWAHDRLLLVGWSHMISSGKCGLLSVEIVKVVGCSFSMGY